MKFVLQHNNKVCYDWNNCSLPRNHYFADTIEDGTFTFDLNKARKYNTYDDAVIGRRRLGLKWDIVEKEDELFVVALLCIQIELVLVAQMEEQEISNFKVAGSNPAEDTN